MRALVDIPERQLEELAAICKARSLSRAEAVRQALAAFIQQNRPAREAAFGIWSGPHISSPCEGAEMPSDGLAYQDRLRSEW